jgi:dynein heavy chain, axonemal
LEDYLAANRRQLGKLKELVDKVSDIDQCRIESAAKKIAEIALIEIPAENEQWTIDAFQEKTEKRCSAMLQAIKSKSNFIEGASRDLLAELTKGVLPNHITADVRLAYESVYYSANSLNFEALVQNTKGSLDLLRARLGTYTTPQYNRPPSQKPFFKSELVLLIPNVSINPKLDDIQSSLNKMSGLILDVSKKLTTNWKVFLDSPDDPTSARIPEDTAQVSNNKDVVKVAMLLSSAVNSMKKDFEAHKEQFSKYDVLWKDDKSDAIQKFLQNSPTIADFENEIGRYELIEKEILEIPPHTQIGIVLISAEPLKLALLSETKEWKQQYGLSLNKKVKRDMEELIEYMENKTMKLSRKIADIDDLRNAVQTLSAIRETEVDVDMKVIPIEEAYLLLAKHNVNVTKEETEMVDSLRYSWKKLKTLVIDTQAHLGKIQPLYKADLVGTVQRFGLDVKDFATEYADNGPMASGIVPKTASERLILFQRNFDELNRKWETYNGGEELFSLPITPFPQLAKIKKELKLLQNLYGLYNEVLTKRQLYAETLWQDVKLDEINADMTDFQAKMKKLPKALKEWDAFNELKGIVDNLTGMVPLLEMMNSKAMQKRHWDSIMNVTKVQFNLDPELFYVKNLLDAPLVAHQEDIEDICTSAVKEADIEIKLKATVSDWEDKVFTLGQFKTRGNLVLKPSATAEIISQMEDSLMTLSSLMGNRYNAPFKPTIQTWVQNLSTASEVIENWMMVSLTLTLGPKSLDILRGCICGRRHCKANAKRG